MSIRWVETRAPASWMSLSNQNNNIKSSQKRYENVTNSEISALMSLHDPSFVTDGFAQAQVMGLRYSTSPHYLQYIFMLPTRLPV